MRQIIFLLVLVACCWACEEELKLPVDVVGSNEEIWVEGFIEAYYHNQGGIDEERRPPYVFIRRTISPDRSYSIEELESIFVNAEVTVTDSERTYELQRFCLFGGGVTEETRQNIIDDFDLDQLEIPAVGVSADSINFCLYVDLMRRIVPKIGETYQLSITLPDERVITASTTIPEHVEIDSFYYISPFTDTTFTADLRQMRIVLRDPDSLKSYYRYFTKVNDGGFVPGYDSVIDDILFDEEVMDFPLLKGETRSLETNTGGNLFGNYSVGDDVTIKWCTIDEAHYNFWDSFEFNLDNQGIFSSYIGTQWNVEGALGIWGGYAVSFYRDTVPR